MSLDLNEGENPLSLIDNEMIINWCDEKPMTRYDKITPSINLFDYNKVNNELELSELAQVILNKSPNISQTIIDLSKQFIPSSLSNSIESTLLGRLRIIENLKSHPNEKIRAWVNDLEKVSEQKINDYKEYKKLGHSHRMERFED